jgi:hypothetical protein
MMQRQKIIAVLMAVSFLCAAVQADMVPLYPVDAGYQASPKVDIPTDPASTSSASTLVDIIGITDLGSFPVGLLPESQTEAGQTREMEPAPIMRDSQSSLSLCLVALFGLGLVQSAPFVKKVHVDCIADRYCRGFFQTDRSSARSLDCLCSAPAVCFVQPDSTPEDCLPQYYRGAIASLVQKSQCTPIALASRGPPLRSH